MKKIILYVTIGILLSSCKTNNEEFTYPSKLVLTHNNLVSKLRLFTSKGEITDTSVKNTFYNTYILTSNSDFFYKENETIIPTTLADTITFISKDTVSFRNVFKKDIRYIKRYNNLLYFAEVDSLGIFQPMCNECPQQEINNNIGISKMYYVQNPWYISQGNNTDGYNYTYIGKGNPNEIHLPKVRIYLRRKNSDKTEFIHSTQLDRNLFDENYLSNLQMDDTIAIQEFEGIYKKIK